MTFPESLLDLLALGVRSLATPIVVMIVLTVSTVEAQSSGRVDDAPDRDKLVELGWLGRFERGPEVVQLRWEDGLVLDMGQISIPADARWHETVSTFSVRHRVTWLSDKRSVRFEEQHNQGAHWVYELVLDGDELLKLVPAGARGNSLPVVQQRYMRVTPNF